MVRREEGASLRARGLVSLIVLVLACSLANAREVRGAVVDQAGDPVAGATIALGGSILGTTDAGGEFSIELEQGPVELTVSHPVHRTLRRRLTVDADLGRLRLELLPAMSVSESVTVSAVRAAEETPVTKRNLDREEIERLSYGQDVPALLQSTPSLTWYSDSGGGTNYSYFRVRGIEQSRINVTYDGAPLNDPAEHVLYFNNFHGFADAVGSIQIQRGVGTSTVGAPAFGGSVNFASVPFAEEPGGEARVVLGSYGTRSGSVAYQSGVLDNGFAVLGRVCVADTEGYRDHSGSEHLTLFLNAGWQGRRSSLKLVSFSGRERSQLAFYAVEPQILEQDPRFNPLDDAERDDFAQRFVQLQYTRANGDDKALVASVYHNGADGWYRLWADPAAHDELLEYGIDQHFVGSSVSVTRHAERLSTTLGVNYNDFRGDHTLDGASGPVYDNTGLKRTAHAFGKLEYRHGDWLLFGDLQLRWARFEYDGQIDLGSVDWTFVDPKLGLRRYLSPRLSVYASVGRAQREPARLDLLHGEDEATEPYDLEAVKPERVLDVETGINGNFRRLVLQGTVYSMEFDDEIALTGELSAVGLPLRRNVDDSYRRGLEIDLRWMATPEWTIFHSANLSRNRIRSWTQYYDVYDAGGAWIGSEPIVHRNVPPLLTPETILDLGIEWAAAHARAALSGRYVADSYLDNTGDDALRADAYTDLDLRASIDLTRWWPAGSPRISLHAQNLLDDERQYPGGYSYLFITRGAGGEETSGGVPYYYPRAGRNLYVSLEVGF